MNLVGFRAVPRGPNSTPTPTPTAPSSPLQLDGYKAYPPLTPSRLLRIYTQLSKARLTTLIVLTAMSGVALSPLPATVPVLLCTALGTFLCSASANTFNQLSESPFDAQMVRTRARPLVRRLISPAHAALFGALTGTAGIGLLCLCVNPLTAALGAFNIWLYAGAYTPLKRLSPVNTWVGALVGAIPPVMGWTACGGSLLPSALHPLTLHLPTLLTSLTTPEPNALIAAEPSILPLSTAVDGLTASDNPLAALALFALLFSWQFPHFNPLAHLTRDGYARAGYHMLALTDPKHNAMVSLRHATLLFPICALLVPLSGLTGWAFALTSLLPNAYCWRAARRWFLAVDAGRPSEKEARALWTTCLWYLPVILGLMMLHKRESWWAEWFAGMGKGKEAEQQQQQQQQEKAV
ncbi:protoheme IX farnesyltransferase [Calocera cornea HHB12733]|uniref:Protoheme IX farnesyltransferase, mitochondrial n=1 Tax=Calocera cornea HHB12733 TaxID=1353952 RepID=A0A165HD59_9BASI|nr:protoheme IX farnesyltransferase [Calocera cornea HHB12733]